MKRETGFTMIELMVVIVIIGILAATALPLYRTVQQRAYGKEALLMAKRILEGQITYFLDHEQFFPEDGSLIQIDHSDPPSREEIQQVKQALKIEIPVGHPLNYDLQAFNTPGEESFFVSIRAAGPFSLFSGGIVPGELIGSINKDGKITLFITGVE